MTVAKIWNGSSWITPNAWQRPRIWNGSTWVVAGANIWNGANNPSKTLTVGSQYNPGSKFVAESTQYGYGESSYGSISTNGMPYAWNSHRITAFNWQSGDINDQVFKIMLEGVDIGYNTGWTSVTFNGYTFNRTAASFASSYIGSVSVTQWAWTGVATNPFPAVGNSTTVTWNV